MGFHACDDRAELLHSVHPGEPGYAGGDDCGRRQPSGNGHSRALSGY